jgi:drug/metabolite transporter (DMT)-like permease
MSKILVGNLFVFASAICLAVSTIYAHVLLQNIDPILFAFYCFSCVIAIALTQRTLIGIESIAADLRRNVKHVVYLNITTAVDWVLYLVALKYIDGSFTNALVFGLTPISSLFLSGKQNLERLAYSLLILFFLSLLALQHINLGVVPTSHLVKGISLSVIAGIAVGGTTVSLKALSSGGLKIVDVIWSRYILTFFVSLMIILQKNMPFTLELAQMARVLIVSVAFVLLPTYLAQRGIKHISSFNTAVISSSIPALTLFIASIVNWQFDGYQMLYVAGLTVVLVMITLRKA